VNLAHLEENTTNKKKIALLLEARIEEEMKRNIIEKEETIVMTEDVMIAMTIESTEKKEAGEDHDLVHDLIVPLLFTSNY